MDAVPHLLHRSGFDVTLLTCDKKFGVYSEFCDVKIFDSRVALIDYLCLLNLDDFEIKVPTEDKILRALLSAGNADLMKSLFPGMLFESSSNLCSKIGLSQFLNSKKIRTPDFIVANDLNDIVRFFNESKCSIFVKSEYGSGGVGVYKIKSVNDLDRINNVDFPVLAQKEIVGPVFDLSAFFHTGKLVFFSYSRMLQSRSNFGPSFLRFYYDREFINPDVVGLLIEFGECMNASGFFNMSAVRSLADNKLYLFEADMRPNVWLEYSKFINDDPAVCIRNYFITGRYIEQPYGLNITNPPGRLLPFRPRLKHRDIKNNRYGCNHYFKNYFSETPI